MSGKRQPRRRYQVIPAKELSWGTRLAWDNGSDAEKAWQDYEQRQRVFEVVNVKPELRRVEEYKTALEDVRMEETSEEKPPSDPEAAYRSRVLPYDATILSEDYSSSEPSDQDQFQKIQSQLKDLVGGFKPSDWMKEAVLYPLAPRQIRKVRDLGCSETLKELGEHQLLINNATSTAFLAVKTPNARGIERLLGPSETDEVVFSEPGSGFGIRLKHGEDPEFIKDCRETKIALIFDTNYIHYVEGMKTKMNKQRPILSSREFYEDFFKCRVTSSRLLSDPEKKFIESRLSRTDIRPSPVRLLEFQTSHQRNLAAKHPRIQIIDQFFCDGQFGFRNCQESLQLTIKYDMKPKFIESVAVTLACELNKKMAKEAFSKNFLLSTFLDERTRTKDKDARFQKECRTIIVYDFPRHLPKYESREWLVRRILATNGIEVERLEKFVEQEDEAGNSHLVAKQVDLRKTIDFELWRTGQRQRTWNVSWENHGPVEEAEEYNVQFANVTSGTQMVTQMLQKSEKEATFTIDKLDKLGPELRPCYTCTFAISRRLRVAYYNAIRGFDEQTRGFFTGLTASENEIMMTAESTYYRVRIHEEWNTGSDAGIIGVMGWPIDSVKKFTKELQLILQPKLFENCPHLLSGAGEIYAKSLEKIYEGALVVEVDKFSNHVKLFGDAADFAIEDLKSFLENRGRIGIHTEIPVHFPFINSRVSNAFNGKVVHDLRKAMCINYLEYDWREKKFEFKGTIEQYEKLREMMEELSRECFAKETSGRDEKDMPPQECPICFCEVDEDYYRFQCGHVLCRGCANNKTGSIEASKMPIKCDHTGCEKRIAPSDILNILLGEPGRLRDYDTASLHAFYIQCMQYTLTSNPDAIECNSIDCPGLLSKSKGDPLRYKKCTSCPRRYCRLCRFEPHKGQTCEEYQKIRAIDGSLNAFMEEAGESVKKCPGCKVPVEKTAGCNKMLCKCGCSFCWLCLEWSRDPKVVYDHLNEVHGGYGLDENPAPPAQPVRNPAIVPERPPHLLAIPEILTEFMDQLTEDGHRFILNILNNVATMDARDAAIAQIYGRLVQN